MTARPQATSSTVDLAQVLAGLQVGQTVNVVIQTPDQAKRTVSVKLGQFPSG